MNNTFNREITLQKLKQGVDTLVDVVKTTSGSRGRKYLIQRADGTLHPTKDGVSIAKTIWCEDIIENMGCKMVQQAAELTVDTDGDGTSLTCTLAQALLHTLLNNPSDNHRQLLQEVEEATNHVISILKDNSRPIDSMEDCIKVATISVNGNEEIGKLVGEVVWLAKDNGVIQLDESDGKVLEFKKVKGSRFERPYEYKQLLGSNETAVAYNNPYIVIFDEEIQSFNQLKEAVEKSISLKRPLVIFAPLFADNIIASIIENTKKSNLKVLPLVIPGYGDEKMEYCDDIFAIGQEDNIYKVVADKKGFTLMTNEFTPSMQERSDYIKAQISSEESPYQRERLEDRLSIIHQKVFKVTVGATSLLEMRDLKDLVEDALLATQSSLEGGYVLGGGLSLWNASKLLDNDKEGYKVIKEAIKVPLLQICKNANIQVYEDAIGNNYSYNTTTLQIEDFYESNIIDPLKVVTSALQNSVSVIKTIISLNGAIIENSDKMLPKFVEGVGFVNQTVSKL